MLGDLFGAARRTKLVLKEPVETLRAVLTDQTIVCEDITITCDRPLQVMCFALAVCRTDDCAVQVVGPTGEPLCFVGSASSTARVSVVGKRP